MYKAVEETVLKVTYMGVILSDEDDNEFDNMLPDFKNDSSQGIITAVGFMVHRCGGHIIIAEKRYSNGNWGTYTKIPEGTIRSIHSITLNISGDYTSNIYIGENLVDFLHRSDLH